MTSSNGLLHIVKTEDGFDTVFSPEYNETYHSRYGIMDESRIVFLEGSGVEQRLKDHHPTKILEIGFGTGFNFFLTLSKAKLYNTKLHFVSIEKDLLSLDTFKNLNHQQPDFSEEYNHFFNWRASFQSKEIPGSYYIEFDFGKLNLILANALDVDFEEEQFDAVYLDAFSPDVNPELWTDLFFKKLYSYMKPSALLSTYSAKSRVKKSLQKTGFTVQKLPGPPHKREFIVAQR